MRDDIGETAREMIDKAIEDGKIQQIDQDIQSPGWRSFNISGVYSGGEGMDAYDEAIEMGKVDFRHQHIETGIAEEDLQRGGIVSFKTPLDERVNGGENMNKLYQAVILDKKLGIVTGESYVTAENKEQAYAKVDTSDHDLNKIKVFLNKIGEYTPKEK